MNPTDTEKTSETAKLFVQINEEYKGGFSSADDRVLAEKMALELLFRLKKKGLLVDKDL